MISFPFSKLMWFAAAASLTVALSGCGGGGGGSFMPATSNMPGDGGNMDSGSCEIGATLSAGQSCSHESTGSTFTFTVRDDGTGCVGGICSGRSVTIKNFSARKNDSGQWEITALPGEGTTVTPPVDDVTVALPGGHGLATGEITVAPGAMQEHGNVVVWCPAGGAACVLTVAVDGTATYDRTGGMPSFTAAPGSQELPGGHGLATGEITVAPGAMQEHGNVVVWCPAGGAACVLTVAVDGTATYDRTGGMPSFTAAQGSQELPGGHGLATGEITVAPGAMQEHGNVVVWCPAGGAACVLTVAADGTATYDRTGGMPSVATVTPMTLSVSVFEGAVNADPVTAANIITAIGKAAQAKPLPGSVTQSSNVDIGGITTDQIEVTVQYGATGPSFWVGDGRDTYEAEWWIDMDMGEGNPRPIADLSPPWKGVHLSLYLRSYSHREGGRLYVDVYSDIEAPSTETVPGVPQDVQSGDQIVGLSCLGSSCSAETTQGTLNSVQGTFTCPGSCSIQFGGLHLSSASGGIDFTGATINGLKVGVDTFDVASAMGIVFTSESTTQTVTDADYLSLGAWLFVPDYVTNAADYVFGTFADGGDPFLQSNIMALQGTVSYEGNVIGVYMEMTPEGTSIGDFNGDVRLNANFGGTSELGTISGLVTDFEVDGEQADGTLTLGTANIGLQNSGFFDGAVGGFDDERTYEGQWGGQFFGNGESDGKPGSVAGTFGGHSTDDAASFVGTFGAHRQ